MKNIIVLIAALVFSTVSMALTTTPGKCPATGDILEHQAIDGGWYLTGIIDGRVQFQSYCEKPNKCVGNTGHFPDVYDVHSSIFVKSIRVNNKQICIYTLHTCFPSTDDRRDTIPFISNLLYNQHLHH